MKIQLNKTKLLWALGGICCLANVAGAAESDKIVELSEVVVTATRANTTLSAVPAAVTVVNEKTIETKNASRLGDVLDQVPSLYLRGGALGQSQGTVGTSGMSLRGIDQTKILMLLDGQPIQDAGSGKMNWRVPFVEDIARVEVVPGAFSSLYGSNAIGGVVNIITKQPDKREFTAKIKKGWSDASGEEASIYFRDKMDNGLGFVGGLGYQNHDSYVNDFVVRTPGIAAATTVIGAQATTTNAGAPAYIVGDKGAAPWRQINATTKLSYDLPNVGKLFGGINYSETDLGFTMFNTYLRNGAGAPVSVGPVGINGQRVTLSESNFVNNSPLYESSTRYFAGFEGVIWNDYLLKIDLAQIDREYSFVNAGTTATWGAGAGTQNNAPNAGLDGTIQLSFPVGGRHFIVSGLSLHNEKVDGTTYALSNWRTPATRTSINDGYSGDSTTVSLFAQDEISATGNLKIYIGGRFDSWETKGSYFKNTAPASAVTYASRNDSSFNSKLSAVYQAADTITLRTSFGQSFRAPTNNDLYSYASIFGITSIGDPNLKPERGSTWEVGGEWRTSDELKINATYYRTLLNDLITNFRLSNVPIISKRINAGKAKVDGVELKADAELASWLTLNAGYAYVGSEMLENSVDPLSVGKRLIDSPKNMVNFGLTAQQGPWTGTLNANYSSKVFSTAQNTDTAEGVPGSYDAHTMVNAKLGYAFSRTVKGALAVNNLLDRKAYSFFLLPGRNITAELDFTF